MRKAAGGIYNHSCLSVSTSEIEKSLEILMLWEEESFTSGSYTTLDTQTLSISGQG
jgi:uncharacterized protein (UPF0333 family)